MGGTTQQCCNAYWYFLFKLTNYSCYKLESPVVRVNYVQSCLIPQSSVNKHIDEQKISAIDKC